MPATSSAPGSQPQAVANQQAARQKKALLERIQTATEIGQAATGVAKSIRKGTEAVQTATLVASGASPAQVARSDAASAQVRRTAQRADRIRQRARAQHKAVKRAIRKDPPKAERLVEKTTKRIWSQLDVDGKGPAPKVQLGPKTEPLEARKPSIAVSEQTAKKFFSPQRKVRKAARRTVVKAGAVAQTQAPSPQERQEAKTELKKAAKASRPGLAKKLNRGFGPNETITARQAAIVAESEGLPGITYAKAIVPGESGGRPGVPNPDDATPSLFQITPSVQSAETQAKFDRIASKRPGGYSNPIVAAKQASYLAGDSADEGVSNYYGFNPSAPQGHLPGGQAAAREKLYGDPKPIPKKVKQEAKEVLGPAKTKQIVKKARKPSAPTVKAPSAKEVRESIVLTESAAEQGAEQGVKASKAYEVTVRNMSPELQSGLVKLAKNTGIPVRLNEGYRTTKRANEFPSGTASQHHQGNAADVDNHADYTQADLEAAGLNNTSVSGEPWHFQPNVTGSAVGTISGSGGSYVAPSTGTTLASAGRSSASPRPVSRKVDKAKRQKLKSKARAKRMEGRDRSRFLRSLIAQGPPSAEQAVAAPSMATPAREKVEISL